MFDLKPLSPAAISKALERAKRYRLLNQPWHAESICRDIMLVEPENHQNLIVLILAITDQFGGVHQRKTAADALEIVDKLKDSYEKDYARGIVYERQAWDTITRGLLQSEYIAYARLIKAMESYEKSAKSHPDKNWESILRWNTCVRMIKEFKLKPQPEDQGQQMLE